MFLDANVVIDGMASRWSLSRAILMLCSRRLCQAVLSSYVFNEIENALLELATSGRMSRKESERMIDDYVRCVEMMDPEMVEMQSGDPYLQRARFIRHLHDVPVLAAALKAKPDWLLSLNRKHFSDSVAERGGIRITTPYGFLIKMLSYRFQENVFPRSHTKGHEERQKNRAFYFVSLRVTSWREFLFLESHSS